MTLEHIIYLLIEFPLFVGFLYLAHRYIVQQKYKDITLIVLALLGFFFHISPAYVTFFQNGQAVIPNDFLFPVYFCNYMRNLLLVVAFWPNKNNKTFRCLATFVAWGAIFGGMIQTFAQAPNIGNWDLFKSAISHSFLILGGLYLFVGEYAKINVYNLVPFSFGLLSTGVFGGITELCYYVAKLPSPNAMYFHSGPVEAPMFNAWVFIPCLTAIIFVIGIVWEHFTRKKEDRWFKTIKDLKLYLPIKEKVEVKENKTEVENKTDCETKKSE